MAFLIVQIIGGPLRPAFNGPLLVTSSTYFNQRQCASAGRRATTGLRSGSVFFCSVDVNLPAVSPPLTEIGSGSAVPGEFDTVREGREFILSGPLELHQRLISDKSGAMAACSCHVPRARCTYTLYRTPRTK